MKDLLTNFTPNDFVTAVLVICALFLAYKEVATNWDWYKARNEKKHEKEHETDVSIEKLFERLDVIETKQDDMMKYNKSKFKEIENKFNKNEQNIQLIMCDQREKFKSDLLDQLAECQATGEISSRKLETLTSRYECYKAEGGNSWASTLMEAIKKFTTVAD